MPLLGCFLFHRPPPQRVAVLHGLHRRLVSPPARRRLCWSIPSVAATSSRSNRASFAACGPDASDSPRRGVGRRGDDGRQPRQAHVHPGLALHRRLRRRVDVDNEAGVVVPIGLSDDCDRRRFAGQLARPAHPHRADLRHKQPPTGPDREPVAGEPKRLSMMLA